MYKKKKEAKNAITESQRYGIKAKYIDLARMVIIYKETKKKKNT